MIARLFLFSILFVAGSIKSNEELNGIFEELGTTLYTIAIKKGGDYHDMEKELIDCTAKVAQFLQDNDIDIPHCTDQLIAAAALGTREMIVLFVDKGFNVNVCNASHQTPLMIAALFGNLDTVQILIEFGADCNARDLLNMTALDYASWAPIHFFTNYKVAGPKVAIATIRYRDIGSPFKKCVALLEQYTNISH